MSGLLDKGRGDKAVHPFQHDFPDGSAVYTEGITLKEYYAGLAMQGILAGRINPGASKIIKSQVSKQALKFANDLITELNNEETTRPSKGVS
jgi:hypothetical protein